MRHLIDGREPITTADIDQAVRDADQALTDPGPTLVVSRDLVARLAAIVADAYGYEPTPGSDDD